ncbi:MULTISPECIES: hypothetical protein [unclassified Dysgonomonas]|uniref:hypothetical protein n=1 Tax=unclassified Dysgonomonas TaxID=2630389 RepID=UPI0013ECB172|nr:MULTISPECIES: hypothetical protein [unclassified Dysgonomonas]
MKKNILPLVLSLRNRQIKEFKMFTGSNRGAMELETSDLDLKRLWFDYIRNVDTCYRDLVFAFIDESRLCLFPDKNMYKYRFEKGALQIYNAQKEEWITFAHGDKTKLVIRKGLTHVEKQHKTNKCRVKSSDETCFGAFNYAGFPSLSLLKDKQAKIAWCNLHYTFQ